MNPPQANIYDAENAAVLCERSADAYLLAGNAGETHPVQLVLENHRTDIRAVVTRLPGELIVSFRGTVDLKNWLEDADARTIDAVYCRIHRGFWLALASIEHDLNEAVFAPAYKALKIWVTGHSLGGALALLWAWKKTLDKAAQPFSGVYTFGQPRIGDAAFRDSWPFRAGLAASTFRVVHAEDLVPHVPWLCGKYRHAGHEIFFPSTGSGQAPTIDGSLSAYFARDMIAASKAFFNWKTTEEWIADHAITKYQALFTDLPKTSAPPATLSAQGQVAGPAFSTQEKP